MVIPNEEFPFLDDTPLLGPPETTRKAFKNLRLRRFPGSVDDIEWLEFIGEGEEGHVYQARIHTLDSDAIYAVKVVCIFQVLLDLK